MLNRVLLFIGGLVLGGIAAWLTHGRRISEAENRTASAESAERELRLQLQQKETQSGRLQAELAKEQAGRVAAETQLAAVQVNL